MSNEQQQAGPQGLEAFKDVKRAIVVCAHADDMETQIAGTVAMLVERGVEFYEVICTLGDLGSHDLATYNRDTLAETRKEEARMGGKVLGFREVVTLDYHDGELEPTLTLRSQLAGFYRKWQPDTLFTFDPDWAGQIHADHRAAGRAAIDALMPSKMEFYRPEQLQGYGVANIQRAFLFNPANVEIYVDVTGVYDKKVQAGLVHLSQFPKGNESLDWMRDLDADAARSGLANTGAQYAERFSVLNVW